MRFTRRKVLLGLIALAVIGWAWSGLTDKGEAPTESQAGAVTLVIDFGTGSGLPPIVRKVENFTGTGWELFKAAGVEVSGTSEFPTGFVCRVEGFPSAASQDCLDTPKFSEGSWAYFVTNSKLGSGWLLSGSGAATQRPECGGFEGWLWVEPGESSGQQLPSIEASPDLCEG